MTTNNITDNEAFEKLVRDHLAILEDDGAIVFQQINHLKVLCDAYVKQETAKEIAELKSQLSILKPHPKCDTSCLLACSMEADAFEHEYNRATELQSQVNMLREAINDAISTYNLPVTARLAEALSVTAPQSLIEHDNEVLERAAKLAEKQFNRESPNWIIGNAFAEAIRALKGIKHE